MADDSPPDDMPSPPPRPAWANVHDVVVQWNDGTRDHHLPPDVKDALEKPMRGQPIAKR